MKELEEFLKVIKEGQQDYKQNDPVGKILEDVKVNIQSDIDSLFSQLIPHQESLGAEFSTILHENLSDLYVEDPLPIVEEQNTHTIDQEPAKMYADYFKNKSFQQPEVPKVDPTFKTIQDKLKFLEQWVGKIAATNAGSGEVNLRYLDDVDRSTIANDRYLKYDQGTNKFVFANPLGSELGVLDYIQLNLAGPSETMYPGALYWNPTEDCLNVSQNDGSTLQVGLENYIEVHNHTGSTLSNGTVVRFGGVDNNVQDLPLCVPMTADYLAQPLYIIGVLTNEIADGGTGRATILGRVHDLDTTGSSVGETWSVGDILWVHPSIPGKLTKVKPTIPQIAISVAAVVKYGVTDGTLLVRPVIWPRLNYGIFSNTIDHVPTTPDVAYPITFNTINVVSGFTLSSDSHIVALESGLYNFNVSIQLSSTNSSAKNIYFWIRKNGTDVDYSTRSQTVNGNNTRATFSCNWTVSLASNQYVEIYWAVDDITIRLDSSNSTAFCPSTPSVLLTVTQAAI